MDTDSDSGLKDAVPHVHDVQLGVDQGPIQRMGDRANKALRRSTRQLRVGIKRQNETNVWKARKVAGFDGERIVHLAEHLIQIEKLAPLSLPSHPSPFARMVNTVAMEKIKAAGCLTRILFVQPLDEAYREIHSYVLLA